MKKRILSLVLAFVMCVGLAVPAMAANGSSSFNTEGSVQVYQKVFDADSEETNIISGIIAHTDECQKKNCTAGSAFVVYNLDTDAIFYIIPVFCGQACIGTIHMSTDLDVGVTWTPDTTLYDKIFDLPDGDYILYVTGGVLYAESMNEIVSLQDMEPFLPTDDDCLTVSYEEKIDAFLSQAEDICSLSNICMMQDKSSAVSFENEYPTQPYTNVPSFETESCDIRYYVPQGPYALCWAACLATILNFKQGTNYTAEDIATKCNIKYKDEEDDNFKYGGETVRAMTLYFQFLGLPYTNMWGMSWSKVKNNIKNEDPFAAIGVTGYGANTYKHSLTVYGYVCDYGDSLDATDQRYVLVWDPGAKAKLSIQYNNPTFIYYGSVYRWEESIAPYAS